MSSKKKLMLNILIFSILLEIIAVLMYVTMPQNIITPSLPFLTPFFLSVSLISNLLLISQPVANPNKFIRTFMMVTFLKLMIYIIVLLAYVLIYRADAVRFMLSFVTLFIFYLIFDVVFLLNNQPKNNNTNS